MYNRNKIKDKTKIIINYFSTISLPYLTVIVFSYLFNKNVAMRKILVYYCIHSYTFNNTIL